MRISRINTVVPQNNIIDYHEENTIYISYMGKYDGLHIFKHGVSRNVTKNWINKHKRTYNTFKLVYVRMYNNKYNVKKMFKNVLKFKNLNVRLNINNKIENDLVVVSDKFLLNRIKTTLDELISTC